MRILLVAADRGIMSYSTQIEAAGYVIEMAETGEDAFNLGKHYEFDVVLLNLQLPDMSGCDVVRRFRAARIKAPIVALSASVSVQPRVAALSAGADDVVTLPLDCNELIARMKAIVRRSQGHSQPVLSTGTVSLNLDTQEVIVGEKSVNLTGKETAILKLLLLRRGMPLTKEVFLNNLYGGIDDEPAAKIIDVFVCKIRKKLAEAGASDVIQTVWGRGYMVRREDWNDSGMPPVPCTPIAQPVFPAFT